MARASRLVRFLSRDASQDHTGGLHGRQLCLTRITWLRRCDALILLQFLDAKGIRLNGLRTSGRPTIMPAQQRYPAIGVIVHFRRLEDQAFSRKGGLVLTGKLDGDRCRPPSSGHWHPARLQRAGLAPGGTFAGCIGVLRPVQDEGQSKEATLASYPPIPACEEERGAYEKSPGSTSTGPRRCRPALGSL